MMTSIRHLPYMKLADIEELPSCDALPFHCSYMQVHSLELLTYYQLGVLEMLLAQNDECVYKLAFASKTCTINNFIR